MHLRRSPVYTNDNLSCYLIRRPRRNCTHQVPGSLRAQRYLTLILRRKRIGRKTNADGDARIRDLNPQGFPK